MSEKELHKEFFNFALDFLKSHKPKEINLDSYMVPAKIKSMKDVYKQLVFSAQNRVMSNNVIGKRINGIEHFGDVLQDFDVQKVLEKYDNADQIFTEISKKLKFSVNEKKKNRVIVKTKKDNESYIEKIVKYERKTLWYQFCLSIYAGAKFLSKFSDLKDFFNFVKIFHEDDRALPALPLLISKEVFGFQVALSCDFLKEIGFINFGKPDDHVITMLEECGFSTDKTSESRKDYEMMKKIKEIADNAGVSAYKFDKILWLIGSGRYYKDNIKKRSLRNDFISEWNNRNNRVSSR